MQDTLIWIAVAYGAGALVVWTGFVAHNRTPLLKSGRFARQALMWPAFAAVLTAVLIGTIYIHVVDGPDGLGRFSRH